MKKNIYLITNSYPFDDADTSFILPELFHLLEIGSVTVITTSQNKTVVCEVPKGVKIVQLNRTRIGAVIKGIALVKALLYKEVRTELKKILCEKKQIITRVLDSWYTYICGQEFYYLLRKKNLIINNEESIIYTYWNAIETLGIALNRKKIEKVKFITRLHGYDLFEERNRFGRQPFMWYKDLQLNKMYFASDYAKEYYLITHQHKETEKYKVFKLGVSNDFGMQRYREEQERFVLASCSNIISLKRIDLIIKALEQCKQKNILWVHFGDGCEKEKLVHLCEQILPKNVEYIFKGRIENQDINKWYKNNYVDAFITTTITEGGCPVSIQEALSYGIPIIGTDVGDIKYMIENNGVLLSTDPTPLEVYNAICQIGSLNQEEAKAMRCKSREIWMNNYNSNHNYREFAKELNSL